MAVQIVTICSVHQPDQVVDVCLPVSVLSSLNEVQALLVEPTVWCVELERPQEVVGLLESWTNGVDLVDQILDTDDVVLS